MNNLSSIVQQLDALPATITKDQFYRICHISKRHAKYLLDSGLVKCVDSGKKTRKYKIEMKDVLAYLTAANSSGVSAAARHLVLW